MLSVSLSEAEIPGVFDDFKRVIGEQHWLSVANDIQNRAQASPHLRHHLASEFSLALQLGRCSKLAHANRGVLPRGATAEPRLYPAFTFAKQTTQLVAAASRKSRKRANSLVRRVQAAFRESYEADAMQLEATVATHFLLRGNLVRWPELEDGRENYDLLIDDLGPRGLEVECKVVTKNKGRRIHREEAIEFFETVRPRLANLLANFDQGLAFVVTVPARLPRELCDVRALADEIYEHALVEAPSNLRDFFVTCKSFDVASLGTLSDPPTAQDKAAVERITGTSNREMLIFETRAHGLVVLTIQSALRDGVVQQAVETMRVAATSQLTGTRPGLLLAQLAGVTPDQLSELSQEDKAAFEPSLLAREASGLLNTPDCAHVIGCGFLSATALHNHVTYKSQGGRTYTFYNKTGQSWHSDLEGMFS